MRGSAAQDAQERTDLSGAVLDVVGSAICVINLEGHVVRWNQAAASLTGISVDQIVGHSVFQETLLFLDDIDKWKREFDRISAGSAPRHFEIRWKGHDGSPLFLICSCAAIRDSAGQAQRIVCTVIDRFSHEILTERNTELGDISRFLHNTVSQDLIALSFYVSELENAALDVPARIRAGATLELIDRCCRNIRLISYMLAPPSLAEIPLAESIEQYASSVREETLLAIAVDIDPVSETVPHQVRLLLFTAVQSWVMRAIRSHPKPALSVRLGNRSAGMVLELEMVWAEYMLPAPAALSNGWTVIREITRALGGEFDIAGDSSRVSAKISLPG